MRIIHLRLGGAALLALALLLNLVLAPRTLAQAAPATPVQPAQAQVLAAADRALAGRALTVATVRVDGGWAVLGLAPTSALPAGGQTALAVQQPDGSWQVLLAGDPAFAAAVSAAPATLLDPLAKDIAQAQAAAASPAQAQAAANGYWLPWPAGEAATVTQNYTAHGLGQIDFYVPSGQVLAAKAGDVVYIQDGHTAHGCDPAFARYNNVVVVRHAANEYSFYVHIAQGSVPAALKAALAVQGSVHVEAGELLAREGNSGYVCGGDGTHLHLSTGAGYSVYASPDSADEDQDGNTAEPVQSAWTSAHQPVDFYEASYDELAGWPFERPIVSQNSRRSPCAAPSAGVVFYAAANCAGESQTFSAESGLVNLPPLGWNDRIRAVAVAPGWSARVYLHTDRLGANRCVSGALPDLAQAVFDATATAPAASMDHAISSFELFHGDDCRPAPVTLSATPAAQLPALRLGEAYPLTVTFALSGMAGVHLTQWRYAWRAGQPSAAGMAALAPATLTQVYIPVTQATAQATLMAMPPGDFMQDAPLSQAALSLDSLLTGFDQWMRPVTVTLTAPVTLDSCGDALEWNGDAAHAAPLVVGSVITGVICSPGDVDYYAFSNQAAQAIAAPVVAYNDLVADLQASILDLTGTPVAASDDAGGSRNALAAAVLPADGTYYLRVGASPQAVSAAPFGYTLQLQSGAGTLPACTAQPDALEPDNTPGQAQAQAAALNTRGEPQVRSLASADDTDWVTVTVQAGVTYTATAWAKEQAPALGVYADPAQPALSSAVSATQTVLAWTPTVSGVQWLRATPGGPAAVGCLGDYALAVAAGDAALPTAVLRLNGGAPLANSPLITVAVSAEDAGVGVDGWRVGADDGLAGAGWQDAGGQDAAGQGAAGQDAAGQGAAPLPLTLPFTLTAGDGERRVFAQVRDRAGNLSTVVSTTITLDTQPPAGQLSAAAQTALQGGVIALAVDASPDVAAMRLRLAGGEWNAWQQYAPLATLDLGGQSGALTVELQVRDRAGNVSQPSTLALTYYPPAVFLPLLRR